MCATRSAVPAPASRPRSGSTTRPAANGSVVFQVFAGATQVYDSGLMTGATATKLVDVSIAGASELRLVVTNGGNNINYDHADWALARIECGSGGGDTTPPTITARTPAPGRPGSRSTSLPARPSRRRWTRRPSPPPTFTLVKQGTPTPVAATVSYASQVATLDPSANLNELDVHGDGEGRQLRGEGRRGQPARRRRHLELRDRHHAGHLDLPQRPHLDLDDERVRAGREGPSRTARTRPATAPR